MEQPTRAPRRKRRSQEEVQAEWDRKVEAARTGTYIKYLHAQSVFEARMALARANFEKAVALAKLDFQKMMT